MRIGKSSLNKMLLLKSTWNQISCAI